MLRSRTVVFPNSISVIASNPDAVGDVLAESAAFDPKATGERLLLPQPRIRKPRVVPWLGLLVEL